MNSLGLALAEDLIQKGYNEDILVHSLWSLLAFFFFLFVISESFLNTILVSFHFNSSSERRLALYLPPIIYPRVR